MSLTRIDGWLPKVLKDKYTFDELIHTVVIPVNLRHDEWDQTAAVRGFLHHKWYKNPAVLAQLERMLPGGAPIDRNSFLLEGCNRNDEGPLKLLLSAEYGRDGVITMWTAPFEEAETWPPQVTIIVSFFEAPEAVTVVLHTTEELLDMEEGDSGPLLLTVNEE